MRAKRKFEPMLEVMGVLALCSGIAVVAVGPLPESNGSLPGGFLESPGAPGVETAPSPSVDLGLSGITPPSDDVTPNPVNGVDDFDALYAAIHPTDPTPVAPAGAFD
jgi:hypothetical protein